MPLGVQAPPWARQPRRIFGGSCTNAPEIEYSASNEDVAASLNALDMQHGQVLVAVTGSADLLINALRYDPAFVAGFDINPAQNALGELKRTAIAHLSYVEYLTLMGYRGNPKARAELLRETREHLGTDLRTFWNRNDLVEAVRDGLWRSGSATRRDIEQWETALRQLEAKLGPSSFAIVLGIEGDPEQREALRAKIARADERYAEPAYRNNNHYKFSAFRYPQGIANEPAAARYAASFLPANAIPAPVAEADYEAIRARIHRLSFQTMSMRDALDSMPRQAFERAYLSNITEYLTVDGEREMAELLLDKAATHAVIVLLYLAFTPDQRRDLLDHNAWSERGFARFVNASKWKRRWAQGRATDQDAEQPSPATTVARTFEKFSAGKAADTVQRVRHGIRSVNADAVAKLASEQARRAGQALRKHNYAATSKLAASAAREVYRHARNRWAETQQLSDTSHVIIENEARTAALFSDVYANLRATAASKSFYGFDYAILHKVERRGPVYDIYQSGA